MSVYFANSLAFFKSLRIPSTCWSCNLWAAMVFCNVWATKVSVPEKHGDLWSLIYFSASVQDDTDFLLSLLCVSLLRSNWSYVSLLSISEFGMNSIFPFSLSSTASFSYSSSLTQSIKSLTPSSLTLLRMCLANLIFLPIESSRDLDRFNFQFGLHSYRVTVFSKH